MMTLRTYLINNNLSIGSNEGLTLWWNDDDQPICWTLGVKTYELPDGPYKRWNYLWGRYQGQKIPLNELLDLPLESM